MMQQDRAFVVAVREYSEADAAEEDRFTKSYQQDAIAISIRDRKVCQDSLLLNLWATFPPRGRA